MKPHQQQALASSSHLTMESLALPQELYWEGKSEPTSPPCNDLFAIATDLVDTENWLYEDNFANEILFDLDLKPGQEIIHDLVEGDEVVVALCDLKEENWPPEAVELSSQIPTYSELDNIITTQPNSYIKPVLTQYDNFSENVQEAGTLTTLTPPQSPPLNDILSVIQQHHNSIPIQLHTLHYHPARVPITEQLPTVVVTTSPTASYSVPNVSNELHPLNIGEEQLSSSANVEVKNELEQAQLVDQIIEELAKDLPDMSDEYDSHYTYSPPSQIEESTTDEEWSPLNSANSSPARYSSSSSCSGDERFINKSENSTTPTTIKKRRPYGRGVEDRKIRKKEQNKNAATRYRQKKKLEMEQVLNEEQKLTQRNEELKCKLSKCVREMKYLKSLIREFYSNEYKKSA